PPAEAEPDPRREPGEKPTVERQAPAPDGEDPRRVSPEQLGLPADHVGQPRPDEARQDDRDAEVRDELGIQTLARRSSAREPEGDEQRGQDDETVTVQAEAPELDQ